jgi:DUF438 domain-containing protein
MDALPLDLTFIDEERRVLYYSESYRVFSRTPDVIGADAVACHSPGTRPRVERLISELESGWRDDARFLERVDGRDVDVRYIAVREEDGTYRGTLEIAQWVDDPAAP